jgi:ATP synthase I chain
MREAGKSPVDSALARLASWMAVVSVSGALLLLVSGHSRAAIGFALGAIVAMLAYGWLYRALSAALDSGQGRMTSRAMAELALRYPLMFGVVALVRWTGWLPFVAVIAGLLVPLAGALIECAILAGGILSDYRKQRAEPLAAPFEDCGLPPSQTQS